MIHNNPGNYPDPMPPLGEACPAPQVMHRTTLTPPSDPVATLERILSRAKRANQTSPEYLAAALVWCLTGTAPRYYGA